MYIFSKNRFDFDGKFLKIKLRAKKGAHGHFLKFLMASRVERKFAFHCTFFFNIFYSSIYYTARRRRGKKMTYFSKNTKKSRIQRFFFKSLSRGRSPRLDSDLKKFLSVAESKARRRRKNFHSVFFPKASRRGTTIRLEEISACC